MSFDRSIILNALVLVAFVLSGISPACAFVSGKMGTLEICAADGSVQTITISKSSDAFALYQALNKDTQADEAPLQNHIEKQDCGFCFAQSNIEKAPTSLTPSFPRFHSGILSIGAGSIAFKSTDSTHFQSRAPPFV